MSVVRLVQFAQLLPGEATHRIPHFSLGIGRNRVGKRLIPVSRHSTIATDRYGEGAH